MALRFYIIRIKDNEYSTKVAQRCYDSIEKFYGHIPEFHAITRFFDAITPKDNPELILRKDGITNLKGFIEPYSRWENVISAFTSHYSIWKIVAESGKPTFIFEHDAVLVDSLPVTVSKKEYTQEEINESNPQRTKLKNNPTLGDIVNVGHPSYGRYNTPSNIGINPLTSKTYFPGAHAYYITPKGAKQLIEVAKKGPGPTDVFINYKRFNNLQEWYPWSAIARDNFSTIQNEKGCLAKHGYNPERYKLVNVR